MKEELRVLEAELAAAEAERDELLDAGAEPARPDRARRLHRRGRRGAAPRGRAGPARAGAHRGRAVRAGARGAALGLALRLHRRRLGAGGDGALPLRARPGGRARPHAAHPPGARPRAGDVRHRLLPDRALEHLRARGRRAVPDRHLGGRARRVPHGGDPRGAPAALRGLLDLLPARGGRRRQGHERHVPGAPVQQGRALRLLRRPSARARSTTGCSRSRRSSSRRSGSPTASSTSPPAISATRPRRSTTSRRGSRTSSATARSRRPRTRPTSRPAGSASDTGSARSGSRRRTR